VKSSPQSIKDFEWASVGAYLQWLEARAELTPVSVSAVLSFRVEKGGFPALVTKKTNLVRILETNLYNLEEWTKEHKGEMTQPQLVFCRSVWASTSKALATVRDHADRAEALNQVHQVISAFLEEEAIDEDCPPF
jgi:hypothetical protein